MDLVTFFALLPFELAVIGGLLWLAATGHRLGWFRAHPVPGQLWDLSGVGHVIVREIRDGTALSDSFRWIEVVYEVVDSPHTEGVTKALVGDFLSAGRLLRAMPPELRQLTGDAQSSRRGA